MEPSVSVFNLFNFANFDLPGNTQGGVLSAITVNGQQVIAPNNGWVPSRAGADAGERPPTVDVLVPAEGVLVYIEVISPERADAILEVASGDSITYTY